MEATDECTDGPACSDSASWLAAPEVAVLLEGVSEVMTGQLSALREFQSAATNRRHVEGTLVRALSGMVQGVGGDGRESMCVGANALRLLCSFSPPLVGDALAGTLQTVIARCCIVCGATLSPAGSRPAGWELFLCTTCGAPDAGQLVPLDEACAALRGVPRSALPTILIPPERGRVYTLRMFIDSAAAVESDVVAGAKRRADCFPANLARLLPPPGENEKDPVYRALPGVVHAETRNLLYEMRELGGEGVRAALERIASSTAGDAAAAAEETARGPKAAAAAAAVHVAGVKADRWNIGKAKLCRMAARWAVVSSRLDGISPVAMAVWKRRDALPGGKVIGEASGWWVKYLTLKEKAGDASDAALPEQISKAVDQLRALSALVNKAAASTESPRVLCARTLQDKCFNGLAPNEEPKKRKRPARDSEDSDVGH
jgi:hypothetical protein